VPASGALGAEHGLKGDLYLPKLHTDWCVEVKHYKDDQISTKLITGKSPIFYDWWEQTVREANQIDKSPLLLFKHDRSKWFVAYRKTDCGLKSIVSDKEIHLTDLNVYIALAEEKLKKWEW
jgi:hypothetical protein